VTIAFVACAESGYLEAQVVLLARSIRANTGGLAGSEVHVFSPRRGHEINVETADVLRSLDVEIHVDDLNREFPDYPIGNKVVVGAWAEANLSTDVVAFVDSDTIFTSAPLALELASSGAAMRPVDTKNIGSSGPGDRTDRYWVDLRARCGAEHDRYVETTVDGERIRAYYNAGLVASRRDAGLFTDWLRCLRIVIGERLLPPDGRWTFADQLALAMAASRLEQIELLEPTYNYPLPKRRRLPASLGRLALEDLVHVHYHRWFSKPGFLDLLQPAVDLTGRVGSWLTPFLPLEPVHDDPFPPRGRRRR
jgi:hypothetical protein